MVFVHLHLHSEYSLLDGAIKVKDLFKRVKELGMDSVAITEHGNMNAVIKKYQAAKDAGIKLIFGMEIYLVNDISVKQKGERKKHLILLAKDNEGYHNLIKLSSIANTKGFYYKPSLDKKILKEYSKGLICLSACVQNDIAQSVIENKYNLAKKLIEEYIDIFGKDNFYLEVQNHGLPEEEIIRKEYKKLAEEYNLKIVATTDAHYLKKEDAKAHASLLCIQTNSTLENKDRFKFKGVNYHITSEDEMLAFFDGNYEWIKNTKEVSDKCNVILEMGETIFPEYKLPEGKTAEDYLEELCEIGLEDKYANKENYEVAKERMQFELSVINKMKFATYFLIVQDFIREAKKKCQVGPGRGCVLPSTKVMLANGFEKEIKDVKIGEKIISHKGNVLPIVKVMNYDCNENIMRLKLRNEDLCLTSDHKIWALKSKKCSVKGIKQGICKKSCSRRCNDKLYEKYKLEWISSKDLKKDDFVVFPRLKSKNRDIIFDLLNFIEKKKYLKYNNKYLWYEIGSNNLETKKIPRFIKFDENLAKLLGYYIAEGWSRIESRRSTIGFGFHKKENNYAKEVKNLLKDIFGIESKIILHKIKNSQQVLAESKIVGKFLVSLCGKGSENKKINSRIVLEGKDNLLKVMISYMFRGDGHDGKNSKTINIKYSTISKNLASQLKLLLIRFGYFSNIHIRNKSNWNNEYSVKLAGKQLLDWNYDFKDFKVPIKNQKFYRNDSFFFDSNYVYYKIKDVKKEKYIGKVWDISVKKDASYVANSVAIHNSGAGSIVAYCLGITQLDPLKFGLLFERFLNPERISLPDFDVDFGDKDLVINYVKEKYGEDKIALIGTFGTMSAKSVIKDVARTYGVPFSISNEITKYVNEKTIKDSLELKDDLGKLKNLELIEYKDKYSEIFEIAQKLEGCVRHKGIHACGVVWGKKPIEEYIPIYGKDGFIITQIDGPEIESFGLVKFDFLGLETLNITKKVLDNINKDDKWLENISLEDSEVYEMLRDGKSIGVFQLESAGMQKTLKLVKPTNFEDIIAIVALYRPGSMDFIETYAARKNGIEKFKYIHSKTEPILKATYGILIYQEQVMQLSRALANFTMGEADVLRKAIGKKKLDLMKKMEEKFKKGCIEHSGLKEKVVNSLWDNIVKFASYSFNKSHAAAYALISYRTAFLKKYYPVEFAAATISANIKDIEKMGFYIQAAKKDKIEILLPDINSSKKEFTVENYNDIKKIRFGLSGIKNVGEEAINEILFNRPFESYQDFINKVNLSKINKRVLYSLVSVGCFDSLIPNRASLLEVYDKIDKEKKDSQKQKTLFGEVVNVIKYPEVNELNLKEKLNLEQEFFGIYLSGDLLDLYGESRNRSFREYNEIPEDIDATLLGLIKSFRIILTKNSEKMAFITITYKNENCDVVVFPKIFNDSNCKYLLKENVAVIVDGKFKENERGKVFIADDLRFLRMLKEYL